jgi:two-component system, sensor histidine kinase and response regulator
MIVLGHTDMSSVFDHAGSLRRMGDDPQLFQEMVGLLQSDAPRLLETARRACRDRSQSALEHAAHTLRGMAANFGATRAIEAAAELEQLAKKKELFGVDEALDELASALEQLIAALPCEVEQSHLR